MDPDIDAEWLREDAKIFSGLAPGQAAQMASARMRLEFIEWWAQPREDREWARLETDGGARFDAWWDAEGYWSTRGAVPPRIEVAGLVPPEGLRTSLPEEVDTVGWWILARVSASEARQWVDAGVRINPVFTYTWVAEIAGSVERCFPGWHLVEKKGVGRTTLTPDGFGLVKRLVGAGVDDPRKIGRLGWDRLAETTGGNLREAIDIVAR